MRYAFLLLAFLFLNLNNVYCQSGNSGSDISCFKFYCYNKIDSILLPSDFYGPEYFSYEEGSIIGFSTHDDCRVNILCRGDAILSLDSTYQAIDTVKTNLNRRYIVYYSKFKNQFARRDHLKKNVAIYENASLYRKRILDGLFDSIMKDE